MSGRAQNGSVVVDICDPDDNGGGDTVWGGGSHRSILTYQDEMVLCPSLVVQ